MEDLTAKIGKEKIDWLLSRYPSRQAALLPLLWLVQEANGSISDDDVMWVSKTLDVTPSHIFGVLTFYTLYKRPWEGKNVIHVCSTLPCALRGSEAVFDALSEKLGVRNNGTTADKKFTLKKAECLAACDLAPVIQTNLKFHMSVKVDDVDRILKEYGF